MILSALLLLSTSTPIEALPLEARAQVVLKRNCVRCHGGVKKFANLNLTDPADLADVVTPGKPEESRIIELIEAGKMPMGGVRVPAGDLLILKSWITEGAKMPPKSVVRKGR